MIVNLSLWISDLLLSFIGTEGDIEDMEVSGKVLVDFFVLFELSG